MDTGAVVERVRKYADLLLRQQVLVSKVVLYGSHVRGTAREDSDIDVAVVVPTIDEDWLDFSARLFRLTRDVDLRISPVALEEGNDASGFLEHVLQTGEIVYSRDT